MQTYNPPQKLPDVNDIVKQIVHNRFENRVTELQRSLIYTCAEEIHNILMDYWRIHESHKKVDSKSTTEI